MTGVTDVTVVTDVTDFAYCLPFQIYEEKNKEIQGINNSANLLQVLRALLFGVVVWGLLSMSGQPFYTEQHMTRGLR